MSGSTISPLQHENLTQLQRVLLELLSWNEKRLPEEIGVLWAQYESDYHKVLDNITPSLLSLRVVGRERRFILANVLVALADFCRPMQSQAVSLQMKSRELHLRELAMAIHPTSLHNGHRRNTLRLAELYVSFNRIDWHAAQVYIEILIPSLNGQEIPLPEDEALYPQIADLLRQAASILPETLPAEIQARLGLCLRLRARGLHFPWLQESIELVTAT